MNATHRYTKDSPSLGGGVGRRGSGRRRVFPSVRAKAAAGIQRGFTLVEIMVGITLLVIISGSGYAAIITGINTVAHSRDITRATQIAQTQIEALRTYSWNALAELPESMEVEMTGKYASVYAHKFTTTQKIEDLSATLKSLRVIVEWDSKTGPRSLEYDTIFAQNGINDYYYRSF